ncbi:hypothetical protein [Streptomyces typhae]|uniref:hypothetical protein n=1 Tax=Streptomyces typhae TaxID=2681492 RepID=UPI003CCC9F06
MNHPSPTVPAPLTEPPRTQCRTFVPRGPTAARALGVFAAVRIAGLLAVSVAAHATEQNTFRLLGRSWDSRWYTAIATDGYGRTLHFENAVVQSDLAFFPLYPGLIRAVTTITPLTYGAAGLVVSWLAAGAAALGIYSLAVRLYDHRTATVLVLLWGLLPHSVILSMAYTEPVLTALAVWALYAVHTGRWLWAGSLAVLAGLARPNGFAVAAAVLAAAGYEVWRRRGRHVPHRLWTGALLAPLGWAGYVLWVGARKGDLLGGYFAVQRGWGSRFDFGAGSLTFVRHLLRDGDKLVFSMTLVIVAVAVLLYALLVAERAPLPLLVYTGVLLLITVGGSGFFESKPRFLLPAFPLLIPVALAVTRTAKARPRAAYLVVGALAGLSVAYGTYLVTIARMPL